MGKSTNSELEDEIINRIQFIQDSANTKYWKAGIFPNFRFNNYWFYHRKDNSIFYTASIVYILQEISPKLSENNQEIARNIIKKAIINYPDYQNKDGLQTYNFYPTKPTKHFANGLIFRHFKHFQLPDDADDTSLIYLTNNSNATEVSWLQNKLSAHANKPSKSITAISEENDNLIAYSTWFGKNMPIEFDVIVHTNILLALLTFKVDLNANSLASWEYIKKSIISLEFKSKPFKVTHNYANSIVIVYHVVRLLSKFKLPDNELVLKIIQSYLWEQYSKRNLNSIEMAMVISSLSKLNVNIELSEFDKRIFKKAKKYSFFLAGMLSAFHNKIVQRVAPFRFFHIRWQCEAHSLAIYLEALTSVKK